jgi:hypothetical protein
MKRKSNLLASLGLLLAAVSLHALTADEWKYQQSLELDRAGPEKFSLAPATLDIAQADLRDLRIAGADGQELPYLLIKPAAETGLSIAPTGFQAELLNSTTMLTIATGTDQPLDSAELETGASTFLKAVRVEFSNDGRRWQTLAEGVPIFRQDGAARTAISLDRRPAAFLRLTLDDERSRPIVITGVRLRTATDRPAPTEPLAPRIVSSDEFSGETVVTLDLGAAHLSLASLEISAEDPLFTRNVSLAVRELHDGQIVERPLARGTIYRIALEGLAPAAGLVVPVGASVPGRELIVHIENGDSPPLHIREIRTRQSPVYVVIAPSTPSPLKILTGNPQANAPRYDLAALSAELNRLPLSSVRIGDTTTNASYRQADPLAGLTLEGAALDSTPWKQHRVVNLSAPGVQQIELDLPVLASAQADLADLRLVQAGTQVPYIFERTGLSRDLVLTPVATPDSAHPSISRWQIALPHPGLPLTRLTLNSSTRLFDRRIQVYETPTDGRGETYRRTLASAPWTHTPDDKPQPLTLVLSDRLLTHTLWIETDNRDNPAIALERTQAFYPVIRLLCKTSGSQPVELVYGNDTVAPPHYDVGLIAAQLLAAEKLGASLGAPQTTTSARSLLAGAHGGVIFWAVLAVVVILLLVVVAKLLPKPAK